MEHNNQLIYEYLFNSDFYQKHRVAIIPGSSLSTAGRIVEGLAFSPPVINLGIAYNGNLSSIAKIEHKITTISHSIMKYWEEFKNYFGKEANPLADATVGDTISVYSNTQKPTISFDLFLLRINGIDPEKTIKDAISYVTPDEIGLQAIVPPGRYLPRGSTKKAVDMTNTYSVVFGEYAFFKLFLPTSVNITPSSQLIDNKPMYYRLSITLEAARIFESEEIESWFI